MNAKFLALALAFAGTVPAHAATYNLSTDLTTLNGYSFASQVGPNARFSDTFSFRVGTAPADFGGLLSSAFRTTAGAITDWAAELTGAGIDKPFQFASLQWGALGLQFGFLGATLPQPGDYSIMVTGNTGAAGAAYSLDIAAAVPEPSEWAMMIAGLGLVSMIAKRRRLA